MASRQEETFLFKRLPQLLADSGRVEDLASLLDQRWVKRRLLHDGSHLGLLQDFSIMARALGNTDPPNIALQVRQALMQSSLVDPAAMLSAQTVALLVAEKVIPVGEALLLAECCPEPAKRVDIYIRLFHDTGGEVGSAILARALDAPWPMDHPVHSRDRASALIAVARLGGGDFVRAAWMRVASLTSEEDRVRTLLALSTIARGRTRAGLVAEARARAARADNALSSLYLRAACQTYHSAPIGPDLVREIAPLTNEYRARELLHRVAFRLSESGESAAVRAIAGWGARDRGETFVALAERLPFESGSDTYAYEIEKELSPASVPSARKTEMLSRAVLAANELEDASDRIWILTRVCRHLPEHVETVLALLPKDDHWANSLTYESLAAVLTQRQRSSILVSMQQGERSESGEARVITAFSPYFRGRDLMRLAAATQHLHNRQHLLDAMTAVAMHAPRGYRRELAQSIYRYATRAQDQQTRGQAAAAMLSPLGEDPAMAQAVMRAIRDFSEHAAYRLFEWDTFLGLYRCFPLLTDDEKNEVLDEQLRYRDNYFDHRSARATIIAWLVDELGQVGDRLVARILADDDLKLSVLFDLLLAELALRLPPAESQPILAVSDSLEQEQSETVKIAVAAVTISPDAFEASIERLSKWRRAMVATALLSRPSRLRPERLVEIAADAVAEHSHWNEWAEQGLMIRLALKAPLTTTERWLESAARQSTLHSAIGTAVEVVAKRACSVDRETAVSVWNQLISVGSTLERSGLVQLLVSARELIDFVAGEDARESVSTELLGLYNTGIVEPGGSKPFGRIRGGSQTWTFESS